MEHGRMFVLMRQVLLRVVTALLFLWSFVLLGSAQKSPESSGILRSYLDKVIGESADSSAAKWINYPTLAYSPETSWEIGVSSLYVYSAKRDLQNRLSEIKSFAFVTLENQYGFWLDHALYTDHNKWFLYGRARYQSFPLFYYGIGREAPAEVQSVIDGDYLLIRERVLRETLPSLYVGLEFDYQELSRIQFGSAVADFLPPSLGSEGSRNLGVGLGVLYDNIHNALNPREGLYSEWAFLHYNKGFASDFDFTTFIVDNRIYRSLRGNVVLAAQVYGQFNSGEVPFNMLSLMGGESLMRGYYLGRYRDRNFLGTQIEYRILPFSFSERLGASVFMATGQVFGDDRYLSWQHFLPTGGAGLRFLIFPDKDIYTRLDFAFTQEGNGVYFFIGEAF